MEPQHQLLRAKLRVVIHTAKRLLVLLHGIGTAILGRAVKTKTDFVCLVIISRQPILTRSRDVCPWLRAPMVAPTHQVMKSERGHIVCNGFAALHHNVANRIDCLLVFSDGLHHPFLGDFTSREIGIPRQTSKCVPIGLRHHVAAPIFHRAGIGDTRKCRKFLIECGFNDRFAIMVRRIIHKLLPHRAEVAKMIAVSEVFLCNLQFCHSLCFLHRAKER